MERAPIILPETQVEPEVWDDPVQGRLGFRTLFSRDRTPSHALTTGVAELPVGGWLGLHRHDPPEVYYVLDGEGMVTLDGTEHPVRAGSSVFVPGDLEHGIRNVAGVPLRVFYVFAVDSFTDVEYRFS